MRGRASSVAELANEIRDALSSDDGEPTARRLAFGLVEAFDAAEAADRLRMIDVAPGSTGDRRYDALLAAIVEHLCARFSMPVPNWVLDPDRFLDEWWFVSGLRTLHAMALVESPISFARRGIFICEGALSYA